MIEENEVLLKALNDVFSEKTDEYINGLSDDGYEYSKSYMLNAKKIIRNHSKPHNRILRNTTKYVACAAVSIMVFSFSVRTAYAYNKTFHDFIVNSFADKIKVTATETDNSPSEIKELYEIGNLPEGFRLSTNLLDDFSNISFFHSEKNYIYFGQYVKATYKNIDFEKTEMYVDENNQEYIISKKFDDYIIVWDNGDYILHINSDLPKEKILDICKSVRKAKEQNK